MLRHNPFLLSRFHGEVQSPKKETPRTARKLCPNVAKTMVYRDSQETQDSVGTPKDYCGSKLSATSLFLVKLFLEMPKQNTRDVFNQKKTLQLFLPGLAAHRTSSDLAWFKQTHYNAGSLLPDCHYVRSSVGNHGSDSTGSIPGQRLRIDLPGPVMDS
jgi:hypothetical protein